MGYLSERFGRMDYLCVHLLPRGRLETSLLWRITSLLGMLEAPQCIAHARSYIAGGVVEGILLEVRAFHVTHIRSVHDVTCVNGTGRRERKRVDPFWSTHGRE